MIDAELRAIMPPLAPEEFEALEGSILAEGCRDAIVVWHQLLNPNESKYDGFCKGLGCKYENKNVPRDLWVAEDGIWLCPECSWGIAPWEYKDTIVDGHNRYEICAKHNIPYRVLEKSFADRDEAILWVIDNQLGRRNLTPEQISLLRGQKYNRMKGQQGGDHKSKAQNDTLINTANALARQYKVDESTIKRDGQFAQAVDTLEDFVPGITARVVRWEIASKQEIIEASKEPETAAEKLSKPHVANNSGENEWYTPSAYIEAARRVMGSIDVDPASSEVANRTVKATTFYTAESNGLDKTWDGNVWINPPYSQPLINKFANAVADKYESGEVKQACVLVNNATDTAWFQRMAEACVAVCFLRGRVKFIDKEGNPGGAPLQGQAVLYFGEHIGEFASEFMELGRVLYA